MRGRSRLISTPEYDIDNPMEFPLSLSPQIKVSIICWFESERGWDSLVDELGSGGDRFRLAEIIEARALVSEDPSI